MRYAVWILLPAFLLLLSSATFADSTQQYNKIYLSPFYVNSISAGGTAVFSTSLNPPDRISSVTSAIIGFNSQINGQTQNFTLRVNGQACNPSSYAVATAFSTTGNIQFYFDCTSRISKSGTYQINLSSSVATGAITGWIEATYMNNPSGNIKYVGGTDYFQGEKATVFLQLQNPDGSAVNNASCNFDMYNTSSMLSTPVFNKQPMLFRGADGIYFYQFSTTGYPEGVYPLDAECVYSYDNFYFYSGVSPLINVTTNSGTLQGGSPATLNAYDDSLYMEWTSTPNVTFKWTNITNTANITSMDLYWMGEINAIRTITFYAYNSTTNRHSVILGTLTTTAAGGSSAPSGTNDIFSAKVPLSLVYETNFSIQMVVSGTGTLWVNWVTLKTYKNTSYVTEVKGSSEVHLYPTSIPLNVTVPTPTVNFSQVLTDIAQVNSTVTAINTTTTANNVLLLAINNTVTLINNYLNGFITAILSNINQTVTAINGRDFAPNITVNASFNVTNVTVVVNTTNTTVVVNTTQVNLENITVVINTTSTTVVVNTTNVTFAPVINTTINFTELNATAQEILVLAQQINTTTLANNAILIAINNTVTAINNYLNGFITTMLNDIYSLLGQVNQTVTTINGKDFMPNITVNTIVNVTTQEVVVNVTNTTYVANITVNNSVVFGGNITINVTAEVNTTQLINDILNAQITETIL